MQYGQPDDFIILVTDDYVIIRQLAVRRV